MGQSRIKKQPRKQNPGQLVANQPAGKNRDPFLIRNIAALVVLFSVTLIAYLPSLGGDLLWDDNNHVTRPELQSLHGLSRIWFDLGATAQYYPLLHTTFWVEHHLWGDAVLGYHLTNVAEHAISAVLVVLIMRRLSIPGALLSGFVFALHPVYVESVAWISEQKTTLSAVLYLSAALLYLYFDRSRSKWQYCAATGLFVLALLSKTVTATLPAALLVIFWWQRGRLAFKRDWLPLLPWLAAGAAYGLFTAWVEQEFIGAKGPEFLLSFGQQMLLAGRVISFYAAKLVWPANLSFNYPHWTIDVDTFWQYIFPVVICAVLIVLLAVCRSHRGPLAGFLFFAGTLFPVLGFLKVYPFRYSYVADHFQYLASLGLLVPIAGGLVLASRRLARDKLGRLGAACIIGVLAILTWRQASIYVNSETLFRETLKKNPRSWMAHANLATILAESGRFPEALTEAEAGLRLRPQIGDVHFTLGNILAHISGRLPDAIKEYQTAIRVQPDLYMAHLHLGNAFVETPGRLMNAVDQYREAVRIKPAFAEAHYNLASALAQIPGRTPDAIAELKETLRLKPELTQAQRAINLLQANQQ